MSNSVWLRLVAAWDGFWFAPASPINLAAARIVIAAHALWILGSRDLPATSGLPDVFWATVAPGDRWRFLLFPGHESLERALETLAFAALIAAILGVWPRVACLLSGLLLYHLAPLETIFWTAYPFERGFTVSILALFVLSFSRCGDALTIVRRRAPVAPASADYGWSLRLVQLFLCQVYFIAGYSKLYRAGLAWATADNMRNWLLVFAEQDQVSTWPALGFWLASHPWLCGVIAGATLVLDLGLITMVFWPQLRKWLIPMALAFHAGIVGAMGIVFLNIPQWLVFVDWDRVLAWAHDIRTERLSNFRAPESPEQAVQVEMHQRERQ